MADTAVGVAEEPKVAAEATEPGTPSWPARAWRAPLAVHVVLLLVALLGLGVLVSAPDSFVTDDGSYELQLRALDAGAWTWASGTEELDPDATHYPVAYADRTSDGWAPLAKHPAWPLAALLVSKVVGVDHAFAVLGIAAVLATAALAWWVGARRGPREARIAFWLAGLAPLAVTATFGWAHAAAAAAAGVALLGLSVLTGAGTGAMDAADADGRPAGRFAADPFAADRTADGIPDRSGWAEVAGAVVLAAGVALGVLLRTEGVLFGVAVAGALVAAARRGGRSWRWSVVAGAGVLGLVAATVALESRGIEAITGGPSSTLQARSGGGVVATSFLDGRYQGAIRSLLDPKAGAIAVLLLVLLVATAGAAVVAARASAPGGGWSQRWQGALALVVVLFAVRTVSLPTTTVTGLVAAWPVAVVGVAVALATRWRAVVAETVLAVLFGGAILATQYPDGGAVQWGGRFFAPLTVPLAVIAAVGLVRLLDGESPVAPGAGEVSARQRAVLVLVAAAVLPTALGFQLAGSLRDLHTVTYDGVAAEVQGVAVTPDPQLPRMMWRHDLPWLVVDEVDGGDDLLELLDHLLARPAGPDRVSLVLRGYDLPQAERALAELPGWHEERRTEVRGLTVVALRR